MTFVTQVSEADTCHVVIKLMTDDLLNWAMTWECPIWGPELLDRACSERLRTAGCTEWEVIQGEIFVLGESTHTDKTMLNQPTT